MDGSVVGPHVPPVTVGADCRRDHGTRELGDVVPGAAVRRPVEPGLGGRDTAVLDRVEPMDGRVQLSLRTRPVLVEGEEAIEGSDE